jgi:hypothetical protein
MKRPFYQSAAHLDLCHLSGGKEKIGVNRTKSLQYQLRGFFTFEGQVNGKP